MQTSGVAVNWSWILIVHHSFGRTLQLQQGSIKEHGLFGTKYQLGLLIMILEHSLVQE